LQTPVNDFDEEIQSCRYDKKIPWSKSKATRSDALHSEIDSFRREVLIDGVRGARPLACLGNEIST
jgi:hypothetical protein